jgi:hypothetical protein
MTGGSSAPWKGPPPPCWDETVLELKEAGMSAEEVVSRPTLRQLQINVTRGIQGGRHIRLNLVTRGVFTDLASWNTHGRAFTHSELEDVMAKVWLTLIDVASIDSGA